jgi:hypothetical protein
VQVVWEQLATGNWQLAKEAISRQHSAFSQTGDLTTKDTKEHKGTQRKSRTWRRGEKPGDLTAKDAEGAKDERGKQERSPQIYAERRRWTRAVGN